MILQALYQYYEAMLKAGRIAAPGLEEKPIRWIIVIKEDGSFVRIESLGDPNDKKSKGQEFFVPVDVGRTSGIDANCLWDNKKYVLGIGEESKKERNQDCVSLFTKIVNNIAELFPENKSFKAVQLFYKKGIYQESEILNYFQDVSSDDLISFRLNSSIDIVASDQDAHIWAENQLAQGKVRGYCLITGKEDFLAEKHMPLELPGCKRGTGAPLVSFNNTAFCSYGRGVGQATNAPISKYAAFAYATAFNKLKNNENTCYTLGDIRYVFWNSNTSNDTINKSFRDVAFPDSLKYNKEENSDEQDDLRRRRHNNKKNTPNPDQDSYKVLEQFKTILGEYGQGKHLNDPGRFYIIGISGGGRGVVKYWQQGTIAEIFGNTYQHLVDMNIVNWENVGSEENPPLRSLYNVVKVVTPPTKSGKFEANLIQSIVESILTGMPYPLTLQQACINQINAKRNDANRNLSISYIRELRAAVLKACINRKIRKANNNHITELKMALDKENTNIAYLAGRLFAVLEQIQGASLGKGVNATIRDRFYGSASTRPNTVMGRLIALSNHHLAKLRKDKPGWAFHFERQLEELFALYEANVPVFPAVFSLDEQSIFAVGYYHQKAFREQKAGETEDKQNESTEKELF